MYGFNLKGKNTDEERNNYIKFNETYYLCRTVDRHIKNNQISYSDLFHKKKNIKEKYIKKAIPAVLFPASFCAFFF